MTKFKNFAVITLLIPLLISICLAGLVNAQSYNPDHLWRLKHINSCPNCNLINANLEDSNLRNANLRNADLEGANLEGANLMNTILYQNQTMPK